jgi:hypothetical protein
MCARTERCKNRLRNRLRHYLHPLTIYCRLKDLGLRECKEVKHLCILYETYVWRWLKEVIQLLPDDERRC